MDIVPGTGIGLALDNCYYRIQAKLFDTSINTGTRLAINNPLLSEAAMLTQNV
jgi:hypothetical protein